MNAILFAAKRVFHGAVRISGRQLKDVAPGLTAARLDMMYALTCREDDKLVRLSVRQSQLRRLLGVTAPVVSRMLRSLETLGWVKRGRPRAGDQRQREVTLTDAGFASFSKAYHLLFHFAKRVVHRAICWGRHGDRNARFRHMCALEEYLDSLRRYFHDRARLYYRWGHPDD